MTPRIFVIYKGSKVHTWCEDLVDGFKKAGCETHVFALRSNRMVERKIQWTEGKKYFDNRAVLSRLTAEIRSFHPKLIIILNSVGLPEFANQCIRHAAGLKTPIVSWLADHIDKFPESSAPNLDAIYYFDSATLPILRSAYPNKKKRLEFLPLAVNPERFRDRGLPWQQRKSGVVFIGKHSIARLETIAQLKTMGLHVDSYGPQAQTGLAIWRKQKLNSTASSNLYGSYQAVLNMLQPPNTVHGLNLRAFEVPASGGVGTYPNTLDLDKSFIPGEEILSYSSHDDLINQLDRITSNPDLAKKMIAASYARVIKDHTYAARVKFLIEEWF